MVNHIVPLLFCDNYPFCTLTVPIQNRKFSPHCHHKVRYFWPPNPRGALCAMPNNPCREQLETTSTTNQSL